jgi:hypothetical protein
LRLCLDEHYASRIAVKLRERGHDVAVQAEPALRGLPDGELLAFCIDERRALVTENVADLVPLAHQLAARGDEHYGLVFSSPASMPRGAATIGLFVATLDRLLREHRAEDAFRNQVRWLSPPA